MAQEPLATKGNYLHIYDFRVQKGHEEEFITSFEKFDYSDGNPMHKSKAQVKDGVLCRDTEDPQRFFLIAEWADIDEHARIRKVLANEIKPEFIKYIEGGSSSPNMWKSYRPRPTRSSTRLQADPAANAPPLHVFPVFDFLSAAHRAGSQRARLGAVLHQPAADGAPRAGLSWR